MISSWRSQTVINLNARDIFGRAAVSTLPSCQWVWLKETAAVVLYLIIIPIVLLNGLMQFTSYFYPNTFVWMNNLFISEHSMSIFFFALGLKFSHRKMKALWRHLTFSFLHFFFKFMLLHKNLQNHVNRCLKNFMHTKKTDVSVSSRQKTSRKNRHAAQRFFFDACTKQWF